MLVSFPPWREPWLKIKHWVLYWMYYYTICCVLWVLLVVSTMCRCLNVVERPFFAQGKHILGAKTLR